MILRFFSPPWSPGLSALGETIAQILTDVYGRDEKLALALHALPPRR